MLKAYIVKILLRYTSVAVLMVLSIGQDICHAVEKLEAFYSVYVTQAITDARILPDTRIDAKHLSRTVDVSACRGEYEPATFTIRAHRRLTGVRVSVTDLFHEKDRIHSSAVDVRIVKCWFQAGYRIYDVKKRILTPELLLKDDKLIRVDYKSKDNYLRVKDRNGKDVYVLISGSDSRDIVDILPRDADTLQPVDIDAGTNKQFWITVRVPQDAKPGEYTGKLSISADGTPPSDIVLRLRVWPFELEKPALRYAIYYRGRLSRHPITAPEMRKHRDQLGLLNSNWKTPEQYLAEMRNLKAHGVEYPTVYQSDEALFRQEVSLRDKAGLPKDALYSLGVQTGNPSKPEDLHALEKKITRWKRIIGEHGYENLYVYGIDEAKGDLLRAQRPAWITVRKAGGKVFAAINTGSAGVMGDILDLAVLPGKPDQKEAEQYHKMGGQVFSYSNPQVGEETPETYRRNFGIALWKAGYQGAMNYAYQHSANHIWNDFDHPKYRDHVFAYPTVNNVIDTVQYEGFREAIDDIRYISTLSRLINHGSENNVPDARQAKAWLENIRPDRGLQQQRQEAIDWILRLSR